MKEVTFFFSREQELVLFLAERGIDWTLPNQPPVMVIPLKLVYIVNKIVY